MIPPIPPLLFALFISLGDLVSQTTPEILFPFLFVGFGASNRLNIACNPNIVNTTATAMERLANTLVTIDTTQIKTCKKN
jgi:hypothetical protein|tara:strand:+ start:79 stop:318 length:240 start_codon:yes stop_codon:yes gene_type:complete